MLKTKRKSSVSLDDWIKRCNIIHNYKYDYSKVKFNYTTDIVIIICNKHGEFEKKAGLHFKSGCIRCSKKNKYHIDDVKELLNKNSYFNILPFDNYTGYRQKIKVICKKENHSSVKSISHLLNNNVNCSFCSKKNKYSQIEWIEICNNTHNNKYDYSLSNYINGKSKVDIICPTHGKFTQRAFSHKNGSGCKKCNKSIGEGIISEILSENKIKFEEQKNFNNLKFKNKLYFDFYLPEYNLCIEFDGLQHSKSYYFFGGEEALINRIKRDKIKNQYCLDNNIKLLRMSYQISYKTRDRIYSKIERKIIDILNEI